VIEDYVHDPARKRFSLVLVGFAHALIGVIGVVAIIRIAAGGAA